MRKKRNNPPDKMRNFLLIFLVFLFFLNGKCSSLECTEEDVNNNCCFVFGEENIQQADQISFSSNCLDTKILLKSGIYSNSNSLRFQSLGSKLKLSNFGDSNAELPILSSNFFSFSSFESVEINSIRFERNNEDSSSNYQLKFESVNRINISNCSFNGSVSSSISISGEPSLIQLINTEFMDTENADNQREEYIISIQNEIECAIVIDSCIFNRRGGGSVSIQGNTNQNVSIYNSLFTGNNLIKGNGSALSIQFKGVNSGKSFVEIFSSNFTYNSGDRGGALLLSSAHDNMLSFSASLSISQCNFISNSAELEGGSIYLNLPLDTFSMDTSIFRNNNATRGGGIFYSGHLFQSDSALISSNSAIQLCIFEENNAINSGGAIFYDGNYISVDIDSCYFNLNVAKDGNGGSFSSSDETQMKIFQVSSSVITDSSSGLSGGAFYLNQNIEKITISYSGFGNNSAAHFGGAVCSNSLGSISVTNSVFITNTAEYGGAFSSVLSNDLNVLFTIFEGNQGLKEGGSMWVSSSQRILMLNATFNQNSAPEGGAILFNGDFKEILMNYTTATGNVASERRGGCISFSSAEIDKLIVTRGFFANNEAKLDGGALFLGSNNTLIFQIYWTFFVENKSYNGGSVSLQGYFEDVLIRRSNFTRNSSRMNGGGLSISQGNINTFTMRRTTFDSNKAFSGGGFAHSNVLTSLILFDDVSFLSNAAISQGGGFYLSTMSDTGATFDFREMQVKNNTCNGSGGGMFLSEIAGSPYADSNEIQMWGNYIESNVAVEYGGGLFLDSNSNTVVDIIDESYNSNQASMGGNSIAINGSGTVKIQDISITDNSGSSQSSILLTSNSASVIQSGGSSQGNHVGCLVNQVTVVIKGKIVCAPVSPTAKNIATFGILAIIGILAIPLIVAFLILMIKASKERRMIADQLKFIMKEDEKNIVVETEELTKLKELGRGPMGRVFKSKYRRAVVAVKHISGTVGVDTVNEMTKEVVSMKKIDRHYHVAYYVGVVIPPHTLSLVLEYCEGMLHLHSQGVIHRNLALRNVMLNGNPLRVRLTEYGLSTVHNHSVMTLQSNASLKWMAPEILANNHFSFASDVYSFAIVLWEILCGGEVPFSNLNDVEAALQIPNGLRPDLPLQIDPELSLLIQRCWSRVPQERPNFASIISSLQKIGPEFGLGEYAV
eukprot:TRINITY_DN4634_c0_g1_i1.p1 TRINITY_DN4634_c0_g1~~TRINITY_DN4634_c0_g1_i1.p1  ORF type:complete len:1195 (+),score=395.40 TRINITY_DN4634_c0_g1_i1:53-3586(+)